MEARRGGGRRAAREWVCERLLHFRIRRVKLLVKLKRNANGSRNDMLPIVCCYRIKITIIHAK